jgi:hypothetical protein
VHRRRADRLLTRARGDIVTNLRILAALGPRSALAGLRRDVRHAARAEAADVEHRVTQRRIKAGELPPAVDDRRTVGDALDAWLRAIKDQRSHDLDRRHRSYAACRDERYQPSASTTAVVTACEPGRYCCKHTTGSAALHPEPEIDAHVP